MVGSEFYESVLIVQFRPSARSLNPIRKEATRKGRWQNVWPLVPTGSCQGMLKDWKCAYMYYAESIISSYAAPIISLNFTEIDYIINLLNLSQCM